LGRDTADILYFLGRAHYDSGNLQTAVESWEKALELDRERKDIAELAAKGRKELAVEGSMGKEFSSRFVVSYDEGDRSDLADKVLDHLETAYNRVGADFSHFPTARIPVLIYTRKDYRTLTNSPDWSGGLYDGKIRLPIGGTTELNAILKATLYHEYTHVVIQDITNGHTPTWLNEGLAELQGRREFAHPLIDLELAVKNRSVLPLSSIQKGFGKLSAKDAALAYQQSYSMAKYLVSTYGWHKAKDILMLLGSGKAASTAFAEALADLSVDYQSFYQEWLASVEKEYVR
jgi:tetratricopeptide (TPR) repeat protein